MAERRGGDRARDFNKDEPPFSRLFVIHGKGFTENDFKEAFSKYGEVQDIWTVKNRNTGEEKGVTYIKFGKASEAALAMEELNQRCIAENPKPIKVVLANSRGEGSGRDPKEDAKMLRIFVIIPKSYSEDDLRNEFKEYGSIDFVSIVKDRRSGEAKGFGYVKYHRPYHAALAVEKCPAHFKPKFADPKGPAPVKRSLDYRDGGRDSFREGDRDGYSGRYSTGRSSGGRRYDEGYDSYGTSTPYSSSYGYDRPRSYESPPIDRDLQTVASVLSRYGRPNGSCEVEVELATNNVTQPQLKRMFELVPGLDAFDYQRSSGVALLRYATPQLAAYACEHFNDFEYPLGYPMRTRLMVGGASEFRNGRTEGAGAGNLNVDSIIDQLQGIRGGGDAQGLVSALRQVSHLLGDRAGTGASAGAGAAATNYDPIQQTQNADGSCSVAYCNINLPPCKPLSPADSISQERLFIVCQPRPIRQELLQDALCRFGNLIDVYLQPGKNFGYARYACKDSATRAVDVLHGQEVNGQRLKVLVSDPPRATNTSRDEPPSKRMDTGERW